MEMDNGTSLLSEREVYPLPSEGGDIELTGSHSSPNWEGDFQFDSNYGEKNSLDPQYQVKIESMDRFAQARRQQGEPTPSGSQSTMLKNIAKRGSNRNVPRGRTGPYPGPMQTTLKMERKVRKNTREKQRRQELNEKFDTLCNLLHLGRKTKAEKFTILSEAINLIDALRRENQALKREKTKLYRLLQRVPPQATGRTPASPKHRSPPSFPTFPPSSTLGLSTSTSDGPDDINPDGPDDHHDDEQEEDLKVPLSMETDDTLDVPPIAYPMPSNNGGVHMNGYNLKVAPQNSCKFPPLPPFSSPHELSDGADSHLQLPSTLPPIHPPWDVLDMSGASSATTLPSRRLSPTSARLDSPLSLSTRLPSPLRSPFAHLSSAAVDSNSQMAF